jgi:predicted negative regulator of RcsB-dependent stress response
MKRTERHHLKANPLAHTMTQLRERLQAARRSMQIGVAAVLGVALVVAGVFGWQRWTSARASERLADAFAILDAPVVPPTSPPAEVSEAAAPAAPPPPGSYPSVTAKLEAAVPKLLEVADAYPSNAQGITARYEAAAALSRLGKTEEANQQYQKIIDEAGDEIYGRTARLGLAESYIASKQYDRAIELLETESKETDGDMPLDAILMRLGQVYQFAGKQTEALATFTRLVEQFPASQYVAAAERELAALRVSGSPSTGN